MIHNNIVDYVNKQVKKDKGEFPVDLLSSPGCEETVDDRRCYAQKEENRKKELKKSKI